MLVHLYNITAMNNYFFSVTFVILKEKWLNVYLYKFGFFFAHNKGSHGVAPV